MIIDKTEMLCERNMKIDSHIQKDVESEDADDKTKQLMDEY